MDNELKFEEFDGHHSFFLIEDGKEIEHLLIDPPHALECIEADFIEDVMTYWMREQGMHYTMPPSWNKRYNVKKIIPLSRLPPDVAKQCLYFRSMRFVPKKLFKKTAYISVQREILFNQNLTQEQIQTIKFLQWRKSVRNKLWQLYFVYIYFKEGWMVEYPILIPEDVKNEQETTET